MHCCYCFADCENVERTTLTFVCFPRSLCVRCVLIDDVTCPVYLYYSTSSQRSLSGTLPPYLSSSLCTYQPSRSLRSSTKKLLKVPKTNLKTFGERSFGYIAPTVWNSLPADLRASPSLPTFKVNLKTHFFRQAF